MDRKGGGVEENAESREYSMIKYAKCFTEDGPGGKTSTQLQNKSSSYELEQKFQRRGGKGTLQTPLMG